MTDNPPPTPPTLLEIFTPEQVERIRFRCKEVMEWGYGRVTIIFANGHPDTIEPSLSEKFTKPTNYKPE